MKYLFSILIAGYFLVSEARAQDASSPVQEGEVEDLSELSDRLDDFIREAIDGGLLQPAASNQTSTDQGGMIEPIRETPDFERLDTSCDQSYPLDFRNMEHLNHYQDIYSLRESLHLSDGSMEPGSDRVLAKGHIALGLNAEALRLLRQDTDAEAVAYRQLALLMDNRNEPDQDFFRQMTSCHTEAGIWLAVALLKADSDTGARLLETHLSQFRQMPLQLRLNIALIVIPALELSNERILAEKLMTHFSEEEIQASTQIRFMVALLEMDTGNTEAVQTVSSFLTEPHFQEAAVAAMLLGEQPVDRVQMDVLLDQLLNRISHAKNEREIMSSLRFVLKELSRGSHYPQLMQLAELPILQHSFLQDEINRSIAKALQADLESEDPVRNLAAIDAMMTVPDLLEGRPEHDELHETAIIRSVSFGFGSLAETLLQNFEPGDRAAEHIASLAFHSEDYQAVFALAQTHPASERINLLAALSAIREQYGSLLNVFESRLEMNPETILVLIEEDATNGQWMVSENVYDASGDLTEESHIQRVQRVMAMRNGSHDTARARAGVSISNVPDVLNRARLFLESSAPEAG